MIGCVEGVWKEERRKIDLAHCSCLSPPYNHRSKEIRKPIAYSLLMKMAVGCSYPFESRIACGKLLIPEECRYIC